MPARNQDISRALDRIKLLNDDPGDGARIKKALIAPLDAILKVDLTAPDVQKKFIQAITTHDEFWSKAPFGIAKRDAGTEAADDAFLTNDPANFKSIKQKAAEQRVLLGLKQIQDERVLLGILNSTSDVLRAYIGKRPELGQLDAIPGWKPAPTATPSKDILSDPILTEIQKNAAEQLLARKIAATRDNALLHALVVANPGTINAAVQGLLGSPYVLNPVPPELVTAAKDLYIKQAYSAYVAGAGASAAPLTVQTLLQANDDVFKAHMQAVLALEPTVDISPEQIKAAQTQLAASYLQRKLSPPALTVSLADINAIDSVAKMVDFVKKAPLSETHKNITDAISADNLISLKTLLVNNHIAKLSLAEAGALSKLGAAKKIEDVKPLLELMGIKPAAWVNAEAMQKIIDAGAERLAAIRNEQMAKPLPVTKLDELIALAAMKTTELTAFRAKFTPHNQWIDTPQMLQLQQKACKQALALKVESLSTLGPGQHAALIDVLQRLPIKKQLELLDSKTPTLGHLLRSTNQAQIKHYLGEEIALDPVLHVDAGQLISKVVAENERIASFQKIQNSAFALVLARCGTIDHSDELPKLNALSPEQIKAINEKLKVIDFNNDPQVRELASIVITPPRSLDVRDEFASYIMDFEDKIKAQRTINEPLANIYAERTIAGKAVLDVLLRLNIDVTYEKDKDKFVNALTAALDKNHTKVDDFIKDLCNGINPNKGIVASGQEATLIAALKKEFSQAEYNIIATEWKKRVLENPASTPQQRTAVLTSIVTMMNDIKPLLQPADPLATLAQTEFSGFAYDAKTLSDGDAALKKSQYMDRLANNTVTIDRLLRAQQQLQECLAVLPSNPDAGTKASIEKMRKELENDLKLINDALGKYDAGQKKLISTIRDLDRIMAGKERYLFTGRGVIHGTLNPSQMTALEGGTNLSMVVGAPDEVAKLARLKDGEKGHTFTVIDQTDPAKPTVGQFTQTFGESTRSQVNSDGTISKKPNIKIEMTKPPTFIDGSGPGPAHTQVDMYMNMALAMIVANGGKPPSKDNPIRLKGGTDAQMEGLWTALHIICKEKYGYSHSKFMESVKIQTGGFDPSKVMTPGRTRWSEPSFNEHSQYKKLFNADLLAQRAKTTKLEEADEIIKQAKTTEAAIESGSKSLNKYREAMSNGRTSAALTKAEVVRAESGVIKPDEPHSELQYK